MRLFSEAWEIWVTIASAREYRYNSLEKPSSFPQENRQLLQGSTPGIGCGLGLALDLQRTFRRCRAGKSSSRGSDQAVKKHPLAATKGMCSRGGPGLSRELAETSWGRGGGSCSLRLFRMQHMVGLSIIVTRLSLSRSQCGLNDFSTGVAVQTARHIEARPVRQRVAQVPCRRRMW